MYTFFVVSYFSKFKFLKKDEMKKMIFEGNFELKKINVSDTQLKASFKINAINKPRIIISRVTGKIQYFAKAWPWSFAGDCSIYDISKKKF